jgi:C4-dicarboxylate transporter DctQ subunit
VSLLKSDRTWAIRINHAAIVLAEAALLALMVLTFYAVVARYGFESPSVHAIELSAYLLLVLAWLSIGWVHHENRHVCMEALNSQLSAGWLRATRVVGELAVVLFCVVLVGAGVAAAWTNYKQGYLSPSLLAFPLWVPYALIPVGALLLGLVALQRLLTPGAAPASAQEAT